MPRQIVDTCVSETPLQTAAHAVAQGSIAASIRPFLDNAETSLIEAERALVDRALEVKESYQASIKTSYADYVSERWSTGEIYNYQRRVAPPNLVAARREGRINLIWTLPRLRWEASRRIDTLTRTSSGIYDLHSLTAVTPGWARDAVITAEMSAREFRRLSGELRKLARRVQSLRSGLSDFKW